MAAHDVIEAKHRKILLQKAFGINPDGTPIVAQGETVSTKTYKSVKSVQQHEDIIHILTHWGDDAALAAAPEDDPEAALIKRFRRNNKQGYNYIKFFELEETETLDGLLKTILKHKNTGGIVLHMLDVFDVIKEAHCQQGHLRVDKTLAACQHELCKIYCENCYICHEKTPVIEPKKGAKKPIISSEFRDHFQVDLIDMRSMRKKDVYGQMQCWIMTVKDNSTGLVYLAALPRKTPTMLQLSLRSTLASWDIPTSSTLVRTALLLNESHQLLIVSLFTLLSLDNGKEFIAKIVVEMMLAHNPNCFIVTGRPRTP